MDLENILLGEKKVSHKRPQTIGFHLYEMPKIGTFYTEHRLAVV